MTFKVSEVTTGEVMQTAKDIVDSIRSIGYADQESFWIVGCNRKRKEIFRQCLFVGGSESVNVDMKIIFNRLLCSSAWSWVAIHNHPDGDPAPSKADLKLTSKLKAASELLGLDFFDCIIIGEDGYFSFAYEGILSGDLESEKTLSKEKTQKRKRSVKKGKYTEDKTSMKAALDPFSKLHESYLIWKNQYPDTILFFDRGDFYELYFDDAQVASRILEISLVIRGPYKGIEIPSCVIPHHLRSPYVDKLLNSGWKVAILEKTGEAGSGIDRKDPDHRRRPELDPGRT